MKFTKQNIESLQNNLSKMERFYAYKYLCEKSEVGIVVRSVIIYIMIEGKLKEKFIPKSLEGCAIGEEKLEITKGKY